MQSDRLLKSNRENAQFPQTVFKEFVENLQNSYKKALESTYLTEINKKNKNEINGKLDDLNKFRLFSQEFKDSEMCFKWLKG
jgi:DNA-binding IscR family transcriptional regulator